MVQDGPRLKKLKEVYKKAVQEILAEEDRIIGGMAGSETRDSFFSDSSIPFREDDLRKIFTELRTGFSEVFKETMRTTNLGLKLNSLDKDIRDGRVCCRDIRDPAYIREIFESYSMDTKENLVERLEKECTEAQEEEAALVKRNGELRGLIAELIASNREAEDAYTSLVNTLSEAVQS